MYMINLIVKTLILLNFGFIYCFIRHKLTVVTKSYSTSAAMRFRFEEYSLDYDNTKRSPKYYLQYPKVYAKACTINYCDKTDYSPERKWIIPDLKFKYIADDDINTLPGIIPDKLTCYGNIVTTAEGISGGFPGQSYYAQLIDFYKGTYRQIAIQVHYNNIRFSYWGLAASRFIFDTKVNNVYSIVLTQYNNYKTKVMLKYVEELQCNTDIYGDTCDYYCHEDDRRFCLPHHEKHGFIITEECKKGYAEGYFILRKIIKCGNEQIYLNSSLQKCMYTDSCINGRVKCPGNKKCFFVDNDTTFCYNESVYIKNDLNNFTIATTDQVVFDRMIVDVKISPPLIPEYAVELFEYYWKYNFEVSTKSKTLKDRIERNKNIRINTPTSIQFIKNSINFTYGDDYLIDLIIIYRYGYYKFIYKFNFIFSDRPSSITFPEEFYFGSLTYFYFVTNLETNQSIQSFAKLNNKVVTSDISQSRFLIPQHFIGETIVTISSKLIVTDKVTITHSASKLIRILPYINFTWIDQNKGRRSENESIECHVSTSLNFTIQLFQLTGPFNIEINDTIKVVLKNILPGKYKFICVVHFPIINETHSRFLNFYFIQKPTQLCLKAFPGFKGYITKCSSDGFPSNQGRFIIQLIQKNYSIQLFRLRSRYLQIPFKIYEHLIYTIRCVNVFYYGDNAYESELIKEISFPLSPKLEDYQVENHPCQNDTSFEIYSSGQHGHEKFDYFRFYVTFNAVKLEIGSTDQILFFIFGSLALFFAYLRERRNGSDKLHNSIYRLMKKNLRRLIRNINEKAIYQLRCKFLNKMSKANVKAENYDSLSDVLF